VISQDIENIFNFRFEGLNTILVGGGLEPEYQPSDETNSKSRIVYREDFIASALHEVSHWCIAGSKRLGLPDFGYWYVPEGRDQQQQVKFFEVELKPQALEWIFSDAIELKFEPSFDNINGTFDGVISEFTEMILSQKQLYLARGLPPRANIFLKALETALA
jgi:elongation factor P hydroxylase